MNVVSLMFDDLDDVWRRMVLLQQVFHLFSRSSLSEPSSLSEQLKFWYMDPTEDCSLSEEGSLSETCSFEFLDSFKFHIF